MTVMSMSGWLVGQMILQFARFITAVHPVWAGIAPAQGQRVYFANHTGNGDFVLIWAVLPGFLRWWTRPVAAADCWLTSRLRRFIGRGIFNAVLIERRHQIRSKAPVERISRPSTAMLR